MAKKPMKKKTAKKVVRPVHTVEPYGPGENPWGLVGVLFSKLRIAGLLLIAFGAILIDQAIL